MSREQQDIFETYGVTSAKLQFIISAISLGTSAFDINDAVRVADKVGDVAKTEDNVSDAVKVADKANDLHRPYIRKSTREAVENAAQKNAKGQFIDPNTDGIKANTLSNWIRKYRLENGTSELSFVELK